MSSTPSAGADRRLPRSHLLVLNRSVRRTLEAENKSPRTIEGYTDGGWEVRPSSTAPQRDQAGEPELPNRMLPGQQAGSAGHRRQRNSSFTEPFRNVP